MKRKVAISLLAGVGAVCAAWCLTACGASFTKANEFIGVTDGVFNSAGFTSQAAQGASSKKSAAASSMTKSAYAAGKSEDEVLASLGNIYDSIKTNDNARLLDDYNRNYIKGNALFKGANLAGLFKSMATVLGDDVFTKVYDMEKIGMPNTVAKLEYGECYTFYAATRQGNSVTTAIRVDFDEYATGKFSFKLAQYEKVNDVADLYYSYYDDQNAVFTVQLNAPLSVDFSSYDDNYSAFTVSECTIALFDNEDYILEHNNKNISVQSIMEFAKNNLGYDNSTYRSLAALGGGKSVSNKQASQIFSVMSDNVYTNPYLGSNGLMNVKVSEQYVIPADVTEVATASIPATKKLVVPAHVQKILDAPFKYPQFVEEIVFEDPDNGALVQIGDDDNVFAPNGEILSVSNLSRHFLLSYTKVKNFTLPKTVKKVEGTIYITTDMETLDFSNYHPDFEPRGYYNEDFQKLPVHTIELYTSVFNRDSAYYKELGSVEKLYGNEDFIFVYDGDNRLDLFDIDSGKVRVEEYSTYNRAEDKIYTYSPSAEIFELIIAIYKSGQYADAYFDFGQYRGLTKVDNLIDELILTDVNEYFDVNSSLYKKISLSADVNDFGKLYGVLGNPATDKEIAFELFDNGVRKTNIDFIDDYRQNPPFDEKSLVKTPDGEIFISELSYKQKFYAPSPSEDYIFVDGEKRYFVGWSFDESADKVDVYAGDTVVNYYQNMHAVYLPETDGLQFFDIDTKTCGVSALDISSRDIEALIIPDVHDGKQVTQFNIGSLGRNSKLKKIILPYSINTANISILWALKNNLIDSLGSIMRFANMEDGFDRQLDNSELLIGLRTCNGAVYDNGLYYLKNNASNYFMLIGADDDLTGQVFVNDQCYYVYVEFGGGISEIVLPSGNNSRLQYIIKLKFDTLANLTIPDTVTHIERIEGTITNKFTLKVNEKSELTLLYQAFSDLNVDGVCLPVKGLSEYVTSLETGIIYDLFSRNTKVYFECTFEEMCEYDYDYIWFNYDFYFYSVNKPTFEKDEDGNYVGGYAFDYWHYDGDGNFAIWERDWDEEYY